MNRLENLTEEERENLPKIFAQLGLLSPISVSTKNGWSLQKSPDRTLSRP